MPRAVVSSGLPGTDPFPTSAQDVARGVASYSFDHVVTIQRDANVRTDDWGHRVTPDWRDHIRDQVCLAGTRARGKESPADPSLGTTVDDRQVLFPIGVDISSGDRLLDVRDRAGNVVFAGPMLIEGPVYRYIGYLSASIQRIE